MDSGRVVLERSVKARIFSCLAIISLFAVGGVADSLSFLGSQVAQAGTLYSATVEDVRVTASNSIPTSLSARLQPIPVGGVCPVQGDLEGKFGSSSMLQYLSCVVPGVERWIDTVYSNMPHPAGYFFVPRRVAGSDASSCPYNENSLNYCLDSQTVYLGEFAVWKQYDTYGDAAPVVVIAHEVTHHFQGVLQMPRAVEPHDQIRYENQADCGAGAFMAYASRAGMMNREDDIIDLAASLADAGEREGPGREHGKPAERLKAFDSAYDSGRGQPMSACIAYVPEIPIVTQR
jgi:hypothetical protein